MKVMELLTPDQLKYKQLKTPVAAKWKALKTGTPIGRGGKYADVFEPKNDPGSVDKVARPTIKHDELHTTPFNSLSDDAYYQYLDMLSKNERMSNNPYFPKIYSLKTYKGSDGRYTYKVNMERLQTVHTLSIEEILMIGRNLFTTFDATLKDLRQTRAPDLKTPRATDTENDKQGFQKKMHTIALDALANCFDQAIAPYKGVTTTIKDSNLKKALMLIKQILDTCSVGEDDQGMVNDIHRDNIMVRRGPFTPQIVITDPIS